MEAARVSVSEALNTMQDAVKRGQIAEAVAQGTRCVRPLSLSPAQVTLGPQLASGAESRVYRGTYRSRPVAVKKPILRTTADLERFREELKTITSLKHPSIVPVLGARVVPPDYYIVMPLEGQSYYEALYNEGLRLTWREIVELGYQLSGAMEHVHEHGILHRDLKSRNVLRGMDGRAKLIDFGIAKGMHSGPVTHQQPSGGFHKQKMMGTLEYMAPEVLQNKGHTRGSDVYAFGVVLNEIASGVYPFSDCTKDNPDAHTVLEMGYGRQELAAAVVAEGLRPTLSVNCPAILVDVLQSCWELDPCLRPTFSELHTQFTALRAQYDHFKIPMEFPLNNVLDTVNNDNGVEILQTRTLNTVDSSGSGEWISKTTVDSRNVHLMCGGFETAGFRGADRMEDRHIIISPFMNNAASALLGVFDGHRGPETAQFAADHFEEVFCSKIPSSVAPDDAFISSFLDIESSFEAMPAARLAEPRGMRYPGCTALTALIHHSRLYVANAGDCRAVLCRDGMAYPLTRDHTAMDASERQRVVQSGGNVQWQKGSWRVGNAGIQVTRSLGDVDLKSVGVCAKPDVTSFDLTDKDAFLVIASDGLWDTVSNEEAISFVHDTVKQPDMCAKRLATEALTRGSQDNITVLVAFLQPVETLERIFIDGKTKYQKQTPTRVGRRPVVAADELFETL